MLKGERNVESSETVLRLVVHTASESHESVRSPDMAKVHVDFCGLCYY